MAPITSHDEAALIGHVLEGFKDDFEDLVRPHLAWLSGLVRAKLRNDADAEDIVQQVILKAYIGLKHFRFEASFRTWLTRIAINEVLQWKRRGAHAHFLALDGVMLTRPQVADRSISPLMECERRESAGALHIAIGKLPEKYRVVIDLRDLQDLSVSETAELLRLSIPAVKTRHRRARLQMATLLRQRTLSRSPHGTRANGRTEGVEMREPAAVCERAPLRMTDDGSWTVRRRLEAEHSGSPDARHLTQMAPLH
jgi:RNA polymerase sigma-70 factor (ECF subfamily)